MFAEEASHDVREVDARLTPFNEAIEEAGHVVPGDQRRVRPPAVKARYLRQLADVL
jgi:hypothetical protein